MKILEINKFHYLKGGADKHFLDVVKLLKEKKHELAVFSMEHSKNDFSLWNKYFVSYVGYNKEDALWQKIKGVGRMFYSFEARRKIKKLLDDFQPDIVHVHNIYHQISPSILPEIKKRGIPIVMTVHDFKLVCPNYLLPSDKNVWDVARPWKYWRFVKAKGFKDSYIKSALVALETKLHEKQSAYDRYIDLYIAPSEFVKNKLVEHGIKSEKIIVLAHFLNEEKIDEKSIVDLSEKYVFHFGRLSREKGVDNLIKLFHNIPKTCLYLAGAIEDDLKIPKESNVSYVGYLNQRELARYIQNSLFVVSASRLPETFGLIALEAMRYGKAFVGYDTGAYSEIVENGRIGYLCRSEDELKEKIEKLLQDENLRVLFSHNAFEKSKDFLEEGYYEKIMKAFYSCLKI